MPFNCGQFVRCLLWVGCVLTVLLCNVCIFAGSFVDEHSIAKSNRLAGRKRITSIPLGVRIKVTQAKGIGREKSVTASVPISGMTKAVRTIQDSGAQLVAINH